MTSIECHALRERLPELAARSTEPSGAEAAHLAACQECRAEWRLIRAAGALGLAAADRVEPGRVAEGVIGRLRTAAGRGERRGRRWWAIGIVAAAATIALLVWSGRGPATSPPVPIVEALPELNRLETAELTTILETFGGPVGDVPTIEAPGLDELNADELERVLDTWEG